MKERKHAEKKITGKEQMKNAAYIFALVVATVILFLLSGTKAESRAKTQPISKQQQLSKNVVRL